MNTDVFSICVYPCSSVVSFSQEENMPGSRKRFAYLFAILLVIALSPIIARTSGQRANTSAVEPQPYFSEPAISPDRSEIAFVSGGDIWTAPARRGGGRPVVWQSAHEPPALHS